MTPSEWQASLRRYTERGILPGGFLRAVLENDLCGAVARADDVSLAQLRAICVFVYNDMPSGCWGSRERVAQWVDGMYLPRHPA